MGADGDGTVQVDGKDVVVDYEESEVVCNDSPLKVPVRTPPPLGARQSGALESCL